MCIVIAICIEWFLECEYGNVYSTARDFVLEHEWLLERGYVHVRVLKCPCVGLCVDCLTLSTTVSWICNLLLRYDVLGGFDDEPVDEVALDIALGVLGDDDDNTDAGGAESRSRIGRWECAFGCALLPFNALSLLLVLHQYF